MQDESSATRQRDTDRSVASATGVAYREYDARGLAFSLTATSLTVVPRHFLLFSFRSINEARAANAEIRVYLRTGQRPDVDPLDPAMDLGNDLLLRPKAKHAGDVAYGLVTRGIIDRVSVKFFDDEAACLTLRAQRAVVERPQRPRFFDAVLEDARSDRRITSRTIVWDRETNAFLIPGAYLAESDAGHANGRAAKVDLDFRVTPLPR